MTINDQSSPRDILVVDDSPANLHLLATLLKEAGYSVRATQDSELALQSALAHPPALLLLDLRMPSMDGFEVCRRLKQDGRTSGVPIIFISGQSDVADRVRSFELGGADFIGKPFQREEILARVRTHLALREAQEELEQRVRERTAELEESLHQLRETDLAMDLAGFGIHRVDAETGRLLYVNDFFCQFHGYTRDELLGMTILDLNPTIPALPFHEVAELFRQQGSARFETIHRHKDGHDMAVEITFHYRPTDDGHPGHFISFMSDITERKRSEETLQHSEAKFRTLYGSTSDAVMLLDENGFLDCNRSSLKMFGCATVEEFCTNHPADLSPPQQPDGTNSALLATQRIATAMEKGSLHFEWMHKRADTGEPFPAEVLLSAMELDGKPILQATVRDITERKEAERRIEEAYAQVRELAALREGTRDEERRLVAREVHDELGQVLTALKLGISTLRLQFGQDNPLLAERVQNLLALADKSIQTVRGVAYSLRPAALDMGIVPALEWLAAEFEHHAGVPCTLRLPQEKLALDEQSRMVIFRVVQEALTNIARYAEATRVEIALESTEDACRLELRDDGKGFDPSAVGRKSFGLLGMKERVNSLGGKLNITSAPGQGTLISVSLPPCGARKQYDGG